MKEIQTGYYVTKDGNIFSSIVSSVPKLLKTSKNRNGYLKVRLSGKTYIVHRLVAQAFISNPENKATVNHINGIKTDNRVDNLEWATYSENTKHAYDTNLFCGRRGKSYNNKFGKEWTELKNKGVSFREIGRMYEVAPNTVNRTIIRCAE